MLNVYIDGCCTPINPNGTASYGLVVKFHQTGEVLYTESKVVGSGIGMSNNVAEYSALIAFLNWLIKIDKDAEKEFLSFPEELRDSAFIYSDSQLLVNQMNGNWKVKAGSYVPYYKKAKELISQNHLVMRLFFKWIPREENTEADRLSKEAIIEWQTQNINLNQQKN